MKALAIALLSAVLLALASQPAQATSPMISSAKAKRIALQFAPPRSKAVEVTPPEVRAQRSRAFYVHYGRVPVEQLRSLPAVGHSALINSSNQAIISFYLDGQIVYQTGGDLNDIASWPLTRDGQMLPPGDSEVERFLTIVAALRAPDFNRTLPGSDELLPGDDLDSPPEDVASSGDGPEAPSAGPAPIAKEAGYITTGERIISAAKRTLWIRETCGDNCGAVIHRYFTKGHNWAWCAGYATWMVRSNGGSVIRTVNVKKIAQWASDGGRYTSSGRPGYLVILRLRKNYDHVGIVRYVDRRGNVATIEGNTPVKTLRRAGYGPDGVATKTRPRSTVMGFVRTY